MTSDELTAEIVQQWTTITPRPSMKIIGERLGVSKGTVAGRLNRAGLVGVQAKPEPKRVEAGKAIASPAPQLRIVEPDPWEEPTATRHSRTCTWPIGEPRSPEFRFCCRPSRNRSSSYCDEHHAILWSPLPPRRVRTA